MALICSLCGGIVHSEPNNDFPSCSAPCCIGGSYEVQDGFAEAVKVLEQKGYRLIGYKFPRSDGWETDYMTAIIFNPHTTPENPPPRFQSSGLPMLHGVMIYCTYEKSPASYKKQVNQSAADLLKWALELPVNDFTNL